LSALSAVASPQSDDLVATNDGPDRTLSCVGLDAIDIGIGTANPSDGGSVSRSPIYFSRAQLAAFLKSEKHKGFLLVWFEKPMNGDAENLSRLISQLKPFLSEVGYDRVRILKAGALTNEILYEKTKDGKEFLGTSSGLGNPPDLKSSKKTN
jgi:hypothetical protein